MCSHGFFSDNKKGTNIQTHEDEEGATATSEGKIKCNQDSTWPKV